MLEAEKSVSTSTVIITTLLTPSLKHDLPKKNKEQVESKNTGHR